MSSNSLQRVSCPKCGDRAICGFAEMLSRLHEAGMLRRHKEPPDEWIQQLFATTVGKLRCGNCGHQGLVAEPFDDQFDDEDWGMARACESCGVLIDAERLELFPDARLCVDCQRNEENGHFEDDAEYCPRCGGVMKLVRTAGSRISRFEMRCETCR